MISGQPISQGSRWHVCSDAVELHRTAVQCILESAADALASRGAFHVVFAGGDTPREVYTYLRAAVTDWARWHVYFGDERCLPANHAQRNSVMATSALLSHVTIPAAQVHMIPAEHGPEAGARAYAAMLGGVGEFDLVLLGLGVDGHTASLFPGQELGVEPISPPVIPVYHAPRPPAERVSLSAWRLSCARQVMFLVTGTEKCPAVCRWRRGDTVPASYIRPVHGVDVFVDQPALNSLSDGTRTSDNGAR